MRSNSARQTLRPSVRDSLQNIIEPEQERIRKEYLHTVLYPDDYGYRMPDELTQPTVLYRSLREFELTAVVDNTVNSGKFSFAVKPILGGTDKATHFQVGIVQYPNGWPTEPSAFTDPSTYASNNLYSDPRVDPMIAPLTEGPLAYGRNFTENLPFAATAVGEYRPVIASPGDGADLINVGDLEISYELFVTPKSFNMSDGTAITISPSGHSARRSIRVPTGVYNLKLTMQNVGTWTGTGGSGTYGIFAFNDAGENVGAALHQSGTSDVKLGVLSDTYMNCLSEWDGNIHSAAQGLQFDLDCNVKLFSEYVYLIAYSGGLGSTGLNTGFIMTSTSDPLLPMISNSGSVIKLRPIGLSCLVTCTLPEINAGGNIVAYSAPSGDIDHYYYQLSAQMGPLQDWQNLARTNKGKLLHDGNFKDGCYVWTQPWDKNDCLMRTPTESLDYPYQGVIVSGQLSPSPGLTGVVPIGRIRIAILYEYTTDNRLFLGETCFGSTADLDWILAYLGAQKHAYENPDHLAKITSVLKNGISMMAHSIPTVIKALETAGKVATILI